jgi:ribose-phosphate pyrophosphokinase
VKSVIVAGGAHPALAQNVARLGGFAIVGADLNRLPDAELVELRESVRGMQVYIVQPTSPPPEPHIFELLLIADAARRAGAAQVTAVVPYFGYARQDRRAHGTRMALGARVAADVLATRVHRLVAVDLHSPAVEGSFLRSRPPGGVPVLVERLRDMKDAWWLRRTWGDQAGGPVCVGARPAGGGGAQAAPERTGGGGGAITGGEGACR